MKITEVRAVRLRTVREAGSLEPAWDPGGAMRFRVGGGSHVEVRTDEGLVGIGPPIDAKLVPAVNAQLVGEDAFAIERHAAVLGYHAEGRPRRGSASVDIALWDLVGKACGQPLYRLWGAAKERVLVYASTVQVSTPEATPALARELLEQGWKAMKLRLHHATLREDVGVVEAVREAVGEGMEIMADANQAQSTGAWQPGVRWDLRRAGETARELQRLGCAWLEEPLPRYAFDELAELRRRVELPIAGGENNRGLHEFRSLLERGVYDILQPDAIVSGGITELRKVAALAEAFGRRVVPHHGGGALGTIAHLHLVAAWPHASHLELLHDPPIGSYQHRLAVFREAPTIDADGYIAVPHGPGLGVEIDPDLVEA